MKVKKDTHQKLVESARKEFLAHGYEKASLKNIAGNAGITAAGIYRHFPSKEAMFLSLVEPVAQEFERLCDTPMEPYYDSIGDADFVKNFGRIREEKNREFVTYMYDHYDAFRLLLVGSRGTPYEDFEQQLIDMEQQSIRDLFRYMDQRGLPHNNVTRAELHILCATLVTAVCEAIRQGYNREQGMDYLKFLEKMLYPGMQLVLGI